MPFAMLSLLSSRPISRLHVNGNTTFVTYLSFPPFSLGFQTVDGALAECSDSRG